MMKTVHLFATTGIVSLALFGCGPKPINKGYHDDTPDEISRLIQAEYQQALYAVGTAHGPSEAVARNKATMQGRAELARQFKAEINALQKNYQEVVNSHPSDEYSQVMEVFASLDVSGTRIAKSMIQRKSSDSYNAKVLVVISAEKLKELIDEKTRSYTSFRAMNAYKKLEERVEEEKELSQEHSQ